MQGLRRRHRSPALNKAGGRSTPGGGLDGRAPDFFLRHWQARVVEQVARGVQRRIEGAAQGRVVEVDAPAQTVRGFEDHDVGIGAGRRFDEPGADESAEAAPQGGDSKGQLS